MNSEKGITMLVLSVAIVVLSIIAGVTINLGLAENSSLVKQVENETDKQREMVDEEQRKTEDMIQKYEDDWGIS